MQVFADQSAYIFAAGSSFARKPTSLGFSFSFVRPSCTSASRPLHIVPARNTLQVAGTDEAGLEDIADRGGVAPARVRRKGVPDSGSS